MVSAKIYAALFSLCLVLTPGCGTHGDSGKSAVAEGPSPPPPAAAATPSRPEDASSAVGQSDVCRLLTSADIEAVQGEAIRDSKGGDHREGGLLIGQCFYATASFNKSVSLTLTQKNPSGPRNADPKDFWEKQFGGEEGREGKKERERREESRREKESDRRSESEAGEEERPARPVPGIGDEAFWVGNQKVGVLYVLKGDRFIRISIGGPEGQETKLEKMKELAKRALGRL